MLYCLHVAYSRQGIRALHPSTDTLAPRSCGKSEGSLAGCCPRHTGTGLPGVHLVPWALPPSEACTLQGPPKKLAPSDISVGSSPSSSKARGCWVGDRLEPVCALEPSHRSSAGGACLQGGPAPGGHHHAATPGSTSSPLSPPSRKHQLLSGHVQSQSVPPPKHHRRAGPLDTEPGLLQPPGWWDPAE